MPGWWVPVALGAATPAFGSEDPLGPVDRGHWYHQELGETAASAAGWSPGAARELGWHAFGVDLYAYHAIWAAYGGRARLRGARLARNPLVNVHFDNLTSTIELAEVWSRILGGTVVGVEWAAGRNDVQAARQVIGAGLHAIQDFYSHSTWINAPARRAHTWLEDDGSGLDPCLTTGGFGPDADAVPNRHGETKLTPRGLVRLAMTPFTPLHDLLRSRALQRSRALLARGSGSGRGQDRGDLSKPRGVRDPEPVGINLDSRRQARVGARIRNLDGLDGDGAFDLAISLAGRESRIWLERLDAQFTTDPALRAFWLQVRDGGQGDWTAPYNDPTVLGYQFIAAGTYPPRGRADSAAWFHRVLVSAAPTKRLGRLRALDADGVELASDPVPIGRAVTLGPLPPGAVELELQVPTVGQAQVHAFRRAPTPELRPLLDGRTDAGSPARLPL